MNILKILYNSVEKDNWDTIALLFCAMRKGGRAIRTTEPELASFVAVL